MSARSEWPPLAEEKLLARLALDDAGFEEFVDRIASLIGPREFNAAAMTFALGYPWERPAESFQLRGPDVTNLSALPSARRDSLAQGLAIDGSREPLRYPLLSFGSNAAPSRLIAKLEHLPANQHEATVVTGELHDFDVGVSAHPAMYGAFPATIFPSPGTAVRAAVLWLTLEQLTAIAWTEMSYFFGRLDGIAFTADFEAPPIDSVLLFVSRLGAHCVDGEIAAMEAIAARDRKAPAFTQEQMLTRLAQAAFGSEATAEDVVRRLFDDFLGTSKLLRGPLRADSVQFASDRWTRFGD